MQHDPSETNADAEPRTDSTNWKESPLLVIKGFLMGSADIVPGVSGGTMALITGIYSRLIHAIRSFDYNFLKNIVTFRWKRALAGVHWKFMAVLLTGILSAILFFTKVVPLQVYMFTDPELIFGLFFGLIVGSIFVLVKAIDSLHWSHGLYIFAGALLGFWVVTLVPTETSSSSLFVFLSGSIAICAMILPGISGSYLLLILRKYDYILSQVGKLGTIETSQGLIALLPFVLGAIVGLVLFSRLLSWLLDRYYAQTLAVLIGFLIGSLYVIWPYQERSFEEFESRVGVIEYTGEQARELRENPPDQNRPSYLKLGEVVNPDASYDELKKVELISVRRKMIETDPYVPYVTVEGAKTDQFWQGVIGIFIGLLMVVGLDWLREK